MTLHDRITEFKNINNALPILSTRALPLTSKSYGVRESKKIKQGAMGLNELTYITKKNIIKLTCRITKKAFLSCFGGSPSACNLVTRACDPLEGTRGSGWPLKWNA